jgi:murein DD-endopeptidase MepM/ murein hydrolase activator NlpD
VTVWALAQANGIDNPSLIHSGQRLLIPTQEEATSLPLPFTALHLEPLVAVQGQTVRVSVEMESEASIEGTFDGRALIFVGGEGHYRTLIGIHAMASPGVYSLDLQATQDGRQVSLRSLVQVIEGTFPVQYLTFSEEKARLLDPKLVADEAERVWSVTTEVTLPGAWRSPFVAPIAGDPPISTRFGTRRAYGSGPAKSYHGGVDYSVAEGMPVFCPAEGRVVLAEPLDVRGNAVIIDHGRGVMSGYWHLSRVGVAVGQEVGRGEVLGLVGSTGLSTGPHLHWEVRVMGIPVDPLQWTREHIE